MPETFFLFQTDQNKILIIQDLHETRKELESFIVQMIEIHKKLMHTLSRNQFFLFTEFYKNNIKFQDLVSQKVFRVDIKTRLTKLEFIMALSN